MSMNVYVFLMLSLFVVWLVVLSNSDLFVWFILLLFLRYVFVFKEWTESMWIPLGLGWQELGGVEGVETNQNIWHEKSTFNKRRKMNSFILWYLSWLVYEISPLKAYRLKAWSSDRNFSVWDVVKKIS